MDAQQASASASPAGSQGSSVEGRGHDATTSASSSQNTTPEPTTCPQNDIQADIELITTYTVNMKAPQPIQAAINRIHDAYTRRVEQKNTELAIRQLHKVVQKLTHKVENTTPGTTQALAGRSYATVVGQGLPTQTRAQQSLNAVHVTPQKPVPARHKREIIVVRGSESTNQKNRSYKELPEQLNKSGLASAAVAICKLLTGDMVITMEDEPARTNWLANTSWLETLGEGAKIKRREFAVIAHGI
jgi:hypothetical protein